MVNKSNKKYKRYKKYNTRKYKHKGGADNKRHKFDRVPRAAAIRSRDITHQQLLDEDNKKKQFEHLKYKYPSIDEDRIENVLEHSDYNLEKAVEILDEWESDVKKKYDKTIIDNEIDRQLRIPYRSFINIDKKNFFKTHKRQPTTNELKTLIKKKRTMKKIHKKKHKGKLSKIVESLHKKMRSDNEEAERLSPMEYSQDISPPHTIKKQPKHKTNEDLILKKSLADAMADRDKTSFGSRFTFLKPGESIYITWDVNNKVLLFLGTIRDCRFINNERLCSIHYEAQHGFPESVYTVEIINKSTLIHKELGGFNSWFRNDGSEVTKQKLIELINSGSKEEAEEEEAEDMEIDDDKKQNLAELLEKLDLENLKSMEDKNWIEDMTNFYKMEPNILSARNLKNVINVIKTLASGEGINRGRTKAKTEFFRKDNPVNLSTNLDELMKEAKFWLEENRSNSWKIHNPIRKLITYKNHLQDMAKIPPITTIPLSEKQKGKQPMTQEQLKDKKLSHDVVYTPEYRSGSAWNAEKMAQLRVAKNAAASAAASAAAPPGTKRKAKVLTPERRERVLIDLDDENWTPGELSKAELDAQDQAELDAVEMDVRMNQNY